MITALVVEDESMIRKGLLTHIPWQQAGVSEVRTAEHAEEAFALCETFRPDIIVSDICMPGMNGVELCKKLREYFPESQIIFVTGYAEKEYLMAAIDLHAISYVEKPILVPEVTKAVEKAVEEVKKARSYGENSLQMLLRGKEDWKNEEADKYVYSVFLFETRQGEKEAQKNILVQKLETLADTWKLHVTGGVLDTSEIAVLVSREKPVVGDKWLMHEVYALFPVCANACGTELFLAAGQDVRGRNRVAESYQSAKNALKCLGFMGWNHYACEEDLDAGKQEYQLRYEYWDELMDAVVRRQADRLESLLEEVYELLTANRAVLGGEVRNLYYNIYRIVKRMNQTYDLENISAGRDPMKSDTIDTARTIREIHLFLQETIQKSGENGEEQNQTLTVQKVRDYILNHYEDKDLSVRTLADQVYLTPTYLSNLFKKATGHTIGQYLVDVRLETAKRLLKDPELKLYQIVPMVGYEDANYFTKIFKKKTGMTPSEYRKKVVI